MGRISHEEKATRARQTLIETIAKIDNLEPILGSKWQIHMVQYYVGRLAELVLYQAGFLHPGEEALVAVQLGIYDILEVNSR